MAATCKTCKWAKFEMTKSAKPRPRKFARGFCEWPIPEKPIIPISISDQWDFTMRKGGIWPDDTRECPAWEPKP